jgi:hypothetical protein
MSPSGDEEMASATSSLNGQLPPGMAPSAAPMTRLASRRSQGLAPLQTAGLPPLHDRVPQAFCRTPMLSSRGELVTPAAASPARSLLASSVCTPNEFVARQTAIAVPGAPIKKVRADLDASDLLGRMSSLSMDGPESPVMPAETVEIARRPERARVIRRLNFDESVPPATPGLGVLRTW